MKIVAEYYQEPKNRAPAQVGVLFLLCVFTTAFLVTLYVISVKTSLLPFDVQRGMRQSPIMSALIIALMGTTVIILVRQFVIFLWYKSPIPTMLRDREALSVLTSDQALFLLLRPFDFDAFVPVLPSTAKTIDDYRQNQSKKLDQFDDDDLREPIELFDLITDTLGPQRSMLAVGERKTRHRGGPGLVRFEEDQWQSNVTALMVRAKTIFVMPWPTEGTEWELNQIIINDMIEKTIFVMPPSYGIESAQRMVTRSTMEQAFDAEFFYKVPKLKLSSDHPLYSISDGYSQAVKLLIGAGLSPPEYAADGCVFFYKMNEIQIMPIPYTENEMGEIIHQSGLCSDGHGG